MPTNDEIKSLLVQVLRNQLTDLTAVYNYAITRKDGVRHREYELRIRQTSTLLGAVDPEMPTDYG